MWVKDGGDLLDTVRQNNAGWILTCSSLIRHLHASNYIYL